jgi:carboxyl-terminal processing protease
MFTEADLSGHLEGKNEAENRKNAAQDESAKDASDNTKESAEAVLNRDYQLRSALNLLKGLNIISRAGTSSAQQ